MESVQIWLSGHLGQPYWRVGLIAAATLLLAAIVRFVAVPLLLRLTRRTVSTLDDTIISRLGSTAIGTVFLLGAGAMVNALITNPYVVGTGRSLITTVLVLIWGRTMVGVGNTVCTGLSENADRFAWIQPQSLPLVHFVSKVFVFGLMSYLIMAAWNVNLTSWLASAGVAGIALGFAAKDTLANFISGVFILADAPYRVGQYIIIDGVTRGAVTEIGMRSTRLLTRDNVEVTVPNAVIGNAKIVNESSGPSPRMRLRVDVGVAYGSDIDQVRELLLGCVEDLNYLSADQKPAVRFTAMGPSSLDFQVLVWIKHPAFRGRVIDELNTRIYQALNAAGVSIPFPQQDVHIKSWPGPWTAPQTPEAAD